MFVLSFSFQWRNVCAPIRNWMVSQNAEVNKKAKKKTKMFHLWKYQRQMMRWYYLWCLTECDDVCAEFRMKIITVRCMFIYFNNWWQTKISTSGNLLIAFPVQTKHNTHTHNRSPISRNTTFIFRRVDAMNTNIATFDQQPIAIRFSIANLHSLTFNFESEDKHVHVC